MTDEELERQFESSLPQFACPACDTDWWFPIAINGVVRACCFGCGTWAPSAHVECAEEPEYSEDEQLSFLEVAC